MGRQYVVQAGIKRHLLPLLQPSRRHKATGTQVVKGLGQVTPGKSTLTPQMIGVLLPLAAGARQQDFADDLEMYCASASATCLKLITRCTFPLAYPDEDSTDGANDKTRNKNKKK